MKENTENTPYWVKFTLSMSEGVLFGEKIKRDYVKKTWQVSLKAAACKGTLINRLGWM